MRSFLVLVAGFGLATAVSAAPAAPVHHRAPARSAPAAGAHGALPWIVDDYPRALAEARARHVPIFADNWAKWCHTCRSMRAYVFPDTSLARHAAQFVWLDLDTENPRNAEYRRKYPINVFPTMLVIDPANESVVLRWPGALTVPQLHTLLDDAAAGSRASTPLLRNLMRADSLFGAGDNKGAADAYQLVLSMAPDGWPGYARVVETQMFVLSQTDQNLQAVQLGRVSLPALGRTPSALNVAAAALEAASALPESNGMRNMALGELQAAVRSLVTDDSFAAAADDRSGAWIALMDARDAVHDEAGHKAVAAEWSSFLDGEAARARTPEQRAVFDSHRLSAYLELGQPERAVPMLQQSERDLPNDYNPPARLATAYKAMKKWDEALAASDRAMAKAYGPRKLLLFGTRADILAGRGDEAGARKVLEEGVAYGDALPEGQKSPRTVEGLRKRLEAAPAH